MKYNEACPNCGSEDYEVNDYGDSFDTYGGEQWWTCTCSKCGHNFEITKAYELKKVMIYEVSES